MNKPNIRFKDGEWLDAERLNKAMEAVDTAADTANAAEASAQQSANSAQAAAQSSLNAQTAAQSVEQNIKSLPSGQAVTMQVAEHAHHLGVYNKANGIPLTASVASGKMLVANAAGAVSLAAKAGWGVTRVYPKSEAHPEGVDFGDTICVPMLNAEGESLMVAGVVMFAIEETYYDAKGEVAGRRLTSVFNAKDAALPLTGELLYDMDLEETETLLISHPLATQAAVARRSAAGARRASNSRTQRRELKNKVDWNSRQPGLTSGMATELEVQTVRDEYGQVVNESQELLTPGRCLISAPDASSRDAASALDGETSVSFKTMRGVTIGGNQMVSVKRGSGSNTGFVYEVTKVTSTETYTTGHAYISTQAKIIEGHKYLFDHKGVGHIFIDTSYKQVCNNNAIIGVAANSNAAPLQIDTCNTGDTARLIILDLTLLFPTSEGQTFVASLTDNDAIKVLHRLGFFSYSQKIG